VYSYKQLAPGQAGGFLVTKNLRFAGIMQKLFGSLLRLSFRRRRHVAGAGLAGSFGIDISR